MSDETRGAVTVAGDGVSRRGPNVSPEVEEKIIALSISGMSLRRIGAKVGLSHSTVQGVLKRAEEEKSETLVQMRTEQKRQWVNNAWRLVDELTQASLKGVRDIATGERELTPRDVQSLVVSTGILHDKIALITGEGAGQGSGGNVAEIAGAVLGAWEAGRQAGMQEATPKHVVDSTGHVEG